MQATRTAIKAAMLLLITLIPAGCERAARAQAKPDGDGVVEILDNPDVLLTTKAAAELTLNGVKLGDPVSAIPVSLIKFKRDNHLDCANASYTIINDHVWSMTLTDRQKLAELQTPQDDPEMIQMRLGKADEIDVPEGEVKNSWKGLWFSINRAASFTADDNYTGWTAVTICR
jgi:hypothetical protein